MFKFLKFKIQNLQMTSNGETMKTKVVVLDDIYNYAVKTFSIGIPLGSRMLISKLGKVNMRGILCPLVTGDFGWSAVARACGCLVVAFLDFFFYFVRFMNPGKRFVEAVVMLPPVHKILIYSNLSLVQPPLQSIYNHL